MTLADASSRTNKILETLEPEDKIILKEKLCKFERDLSEYYAVKMNLQRVEKMLEKSDHLLESRLKMYEYALTIKVME